MFLNFRQPNLVEPLASFYQQRHQMTNNAQSYYTVVNQTLAKNAFQNARKEEQKTDSDQSNE